jgi:phosphate:Na+ symporter
MLGNYLVKLSARQISKADSGEAAGLLKVIGDFERIADHAVNLLESAEEMKQKGIKFTAEAAEELRRITSAVEEILDLSIAAFVENDVETAAKVEPLEEIIDEQKEQLRTWHIHRMQQGNCTMDAGYIWSDLLTNLERTADHCCNIAGCVLEGKE